MPAATTLTGETGETFYEFEVMAWIRWNPPVYWRAIDDHVIADRHLPDGTRQHMVRGHVLAGRVVDNAQVIGEEDLVSDIAYS